MTLEWRQHDGDQNCWLSICGRYSVSTHDGIWDAWRMNVEGSLFAQIGRNLASAAEAKTICEGNAQ